MLIWIFVLSICIFWAILFYPRATKWRKKWKIVDTEIDRLTVLHIMNKFEIFQNNKQENEINKIVEKNNEWYSYKIREKIWQWFSYDWVEYIINIVLLSTSLYISFIIFEWEATLWDFVLFTWFASLLWNQIRSFSMISKKFSDNFIHIEKMEEMIEKIKEKNEINEKDKKEFIYVNWDIEIKNINFSYDNSNVFDNFSLNIKWWLKTAFVWESWWWKSTLIKLLSWYIKIDKWDILIDWQKISKIKMSEYYKHVWYLTQDPSVFDGTIYENLTYALKENPTEAELDKCIKLSKCEFIYEFDKWLQTEIWERWIRLSWWQKQRLAIAKIMLKNPNIILLDEPTSALDSFNEEMIEAALNNLFKWKTVLIIAHRLQTVKNADEIFVIDNWKVIEKGSHKDLIKIKWKYNKMLELQSWF
jgi:ABC-type multidrug transport system fused ATPase/permease subunit